MPAIAIILIGFAAGLFYSYICLNRELLEKNLGGDKNLAQRAIRALTEAAVKVAPEGKQNSFGSRAGRLTRAFQGLLGLLLDIAARILGPNGGGDCQHDGKSQIRGQGAARTRR